LAKTPVVRSTAFEAALLIKPPALPGVSDFFLTRPDGTTAAERFFDQKPHSMFAAILESIELAPAPLSPPRKA
jgi:hypothetical protein